MLHSIFSYFVSRQDDAGQRRLGYLSWFVLQYPQEEFRREEAIFRNFMGYCSKLSVPLKLSYFEVYLSTELKKFLVESKTKIDGTENLSYEEPNSLETAVQTTRDVMLANYREIEANAVDLDDFPVMMNAFRVERLNERTTEVLGQTYDLIAKHGTEDGNAFAMERLTALRETYDEAALEEIANFGVSEQAMEPVVDSGIPAIDKDIVALCRTQLLDISAPPGAGKTRMAIGVFSHRALLAGKNVLYYTLEQSKAEIEAMLTSRHLYHMYKDIVSDKMITTKSVPKELQAKVEAARIDILESGRYGKFEVHATDLYLEDFIEKIKMQDRISGPFDVIVIDHMSLMQSIPPKYGRPLDDYRVVAKSYRKFKQFVRNNKKVGISINQFNREGIEASRQDKEINATMGAGGIEAYRSTDANITITYTEAMAAKGQRKISLPKSRSSAGFGSIAVDVRLECCLFAQAKAQLP